MKIEPQHIKKVWVAMTNTDLTEGRGSEYALFICESETTAIRLGKGKYVMGTDCRIQESKIFYLKGEGWYGPVGRVYPSSDEDKREESKLKKERAKNLVIEKFEKGEEISPEERTVILEILKK
jgi:hypothetical protein